MTQPFTNVQGRCPACGWTTLFLGDGGYVTCSRADCPQPDAASTLLERDPRMTAHDTVGAVARPQLHDAIRALARMDRPWWDAELSRMARLEGRTSFLGRRR
jgi:hypothetical protein